jgi:hypothetical protein
MPSPVIHIGYALGFGSLIMTSTKGSFTPIHCLLLSLNGFIGPDLGSFISWCFSVTFPLIADQAMTWIHHSLGYIVLIAPIIAFLSSRLLKKMINWKSTRSLNGGDLDQTHRNSMLLSMKDCYFLSVAGCLLHFQIDHIFEENGQDKFYQWILSTGYFTKPTPPLLPFSVVFASLSTLALFIGFAWIHLFSSSISKQSLSIRLKYTLTLFIIVFTFYLIFLIISQIILGNKGVIGEEADLGVLVFIIGFHFVPFILCLLSISN